MRLLKSLLALGLMTSFMFNAGCSGAFTDEIFQYEGQLKNQDQEPFNEKAVSGVYYMDIEISAYDDDQSNDGNPVIVFDQQHTTDPLDGRFEGEFVENLKHREQEFHCSQQCTDYDHETGLCDNYNEVCEEEYETDYYDLEDVSSVTTEFSAQWNNATITMGGVNVSEDYNQNEYFRVDKFFLPFSSSGSGTEAAGLSRTREEQAGKQNKLTEIPSWAGPGTAYPHRKQRRIDSSKAERQLWCKEEIQGDQPPGLAFGNCAMQGSRVFHKLRENKNEHPEPKKQNPFVEAKPSRKITDCSDAAQDAEKQKLCAAHSVYLELFEGVKKLKQLLQDKKEVKDLDAKQKEELQNLINNAPLREAVKKLLGRPDLNLQQLLSGEKSKV